MSDRDGPEAPSASARRRGAWLVALIVLAALAARVPGFLEGEWQGNRDELNYVPKAVRMAGGDLNPHYFQNPPLATYLMLAGIGARWAWGRLTGEFASAIDFKAAFLADGGGAFAASRAVSLVLGLASVVAAALLARTLCRRGTGDRAALVAAPLAALALAASPLHAERSAMATNEVLVTLAFTLAVHAAVVLARTGTLRAAVVAGALGGIAGASKYTGALVCVAVGAAALLADGRDARTRIRLAAAAGAAAVAAFLVACPWCVLDHATFRAHVLDLTTQKDRFQDDRGWLRYAETAWTTGLGRVWTVLGLGGAGAAIAAAVRVRQERAAAIVVLAAIAAPAAYLVSHTHMAYGRYLLPAYPAAIALGAAWVASWEGRLAWARPAAVAAAGLSAAASFAEAGARFADLSRPTTREAAAAWIRANVPDGAHVVGDWDLPRLPSVEDREAFAGKVSPSVAARFVPAWRTTTAWDYRALPVSRVRGTQIPADDLEGLRRIAPVWFVTSSACEGAFAGFPPGDYPPLRWYEAVRRGTTSVAEVRARLDVRGPDLRIGVLR